MVDHMQRNTNEEYNNYGGKRQKIHEIEGVQNVWKHKYKKFPCVANP